MTSDFIGALMPLVDAALKEKNLTPTEASRLAESPQIIRNLKRGHMPAADRLQRLCAVLDIDFRFGPAALPQSTFARANVDSPSPSPAADIDRLASELEDLAGELGRRAREIRRLSRGGG